MEGGRELLVGIAVACVLVLSSCQKDTGAKQIALDKFGGKLTLRLSLHKGEKFEYEDVLSITAHTPTRDRGYTSTETRELEVGDCTSSALQVFDTLRHVKFEPSDAAPKTTRERMDRMMGKRIGLSCSPTAAILKAGTESDDPAVRKDVESQYTPGRGLSGVVFAKDPIAIGDSWTSTLDLSKVFGALSGLGDQAARLSKIPVTYRLVSAEEDGGRVLAVIDYTTDFTIPGAHSASSPALSYKSTGTCRIDTASGMLIKDDGRTTTTMNIGSRSVTITDKSRERMTGER
jgi:hypothetical protein